MNSLDYVVLLLIVVSIIVLIIYTRKENYLTMSQLGQDIDVPEYDVIVNPGDDTQHAYTYDRHQYTTDKRRYNFLNRKNTLFNTH